MSFGMQIFDSSGGLLADANLIGFFCRRSVTTTTTTSVGGGNTVPSNLVVPIAGMGYTYPIIAISSLEFFGKSGITSGGDAVFVCSGPVGTSVTYYVFDWAANLPAPSGNNILGIEMFDSSGNRTFSSNFFPMQGLSIITSGSFTSTGKTLAAGLPAYGGFREAGDLDYYSGGVLVIPSGPGSYDSTGYQNSADVYGARVVNSGQTVEYGSISFDNVYIGPEFGDIVPPPDWNILANIIPIDVTNIPINTVFF
jgi:hypothetical protein